MGFHLTATTAFWNSEALRCVTGAAQAAHMHKHHRSGKSAAHYHSHPDPGTDQPWKGLVNASTLGCPACPCRSTMLQGLLTLFAECFSPFNHFTGALSVLHHSMQHWQECTCSSQAAMQSSPTQWLADANQKPLTARTPQGSHPGSRCAFHTHLALSVSSNS